jgi:uncharacterized membrane protein YoaK (UPF0700 family)
VDAVSYFSLDHVFTANMSGNIALLGIGAAHGFGPVVGNVFAFAGFVGGSVAIGRFVRGSSASFWRVTANALLAELALLVLLACAIAAAGGVHRDALRFGVCAVLAAAMGIQTGIARHLAAQDVNTTVATMTLHDLAASSRVAGGDSVRWRRRVGVVLALFAGAAIGVALDDVVPWGGLGFASVVVAGVTAWTLHDLRTGDASPSVVRT